MKFDFDYITETLEQMAFKAAAAEQIRLRPLEEMVDEELEHFHDALSSELSEMIVQAIRTEGEHI